MVTTGIIQNITNNWKRREAIEVLNFFQSRKYYVDTLRIEHTWIFRTTIVTPEELKTEVVQKD